MAVCQVQVTRQRFSLDAAAASLGAPLRVPCHVSRRIPPCFFTPFMAEQRLSGEWLQLSRLKPSFVFVTPSSLPRRRHGGLHDHYLQPAKSQGELCACPELRRAASLQCDAGRRYLHTSNELNLA